MNSSDEYVMESFVTFDKMPFIIYDLLLTEVWKDKVYSVIKDKISAVNSIRQYMSVSELQFPPDLNMLAN